jgi:iron(III) transport system ATP-binding protein
VDGLESAAGSPPEATPAHIEIEELSKNFGGTPAVRDLSLSVGDGEFLVLLGPSGCGKSTTMRCLVGLERPDTGTIKVAGRTLFSAAAGIDVPPNKRRMGMVFQSYALWPHKNVYKNVAFPLQMQRRPRSAISAAVRDALRIVGLDGFERRSVTSLSGGQMQRVALARSLVMNPQILLLDEPLSNLDAKLRVHLRHELKEIQQRVGITTVYVTHDQDEALGLADRIVVMRDGTIAQQGPPEQLFGRPADTFVADFLGMSNQYSATIVAVPRAGWVDASLDGTALTIRCADGRRDRSRSGTLCARPESIRVTPVRDESGCGARGRLLSVQYQGTRVRYHAQLDEGPEVFADSPARAERLRPGDQCQVMFDPAETLFLDGAPERGSEAGGT